MRAGYYGRAKIMLPMVSTVEEIRKSKEIIKELKKQLKDENHHFDENIEIGTMIEVPSAALTTDIIAPEVDFVSVGTNDLVQYTVAVDRNNLKIAHLYSYFNLGVLRLIKEVVENAHKVNIKVHVCGEMASEPLATILLIGLGVDELSMTALMIPQIKKIIRSFSYRESKDLTEKVLGMKTQAEIEKCLRSVLFKRLPDLKLTNI